MRSLGARLAQIAISNRIRYNHLLSLWLFGIVADARLNCTMRGLERQRAITRSAPTSNATPYSRSSSSYSFLTVCRTSKSTMPAPSSTVLSTSDQNYHVILTTEPLDTANIVDVPADLSTPFDYLTNSDTDADNDDLCSSRRWEWYCKDPACPKYWSAWSCKSNIELHLYTRQLCTARIYGYIRG